MGSLTPGGLPISQANNKIHHSHRGNFVKRSNTDTDTGVVVSNSGVIKIENYDLPFGREFALSPARTFVSGIDLTSRELFWNASENGPSGIRRIEYDKFANDSGNLQHVVTRAMGIHTSVMDRESPNAGSGPMVARTERKIFFFDSDRNKTSGFADWEIFDASGCPVGTSLGTTDTDVSPAPTYDQPC